MWQIMPSTSWGQEEETKCATPGANYVAANGSELENKGDYDVIWSTSDGRERVTTFQDADVGMPTIAISQAAKDKHRTGVEDDGVCFAQTYRAQVCSHQLIRRVFHKDERSEKLRECTVWRAWPSMSSNWVSASPFLCMMTDAQPAPRREHANMKMDLSHVDVTDLHGTAVLGEPIVGVGGTTYDERGQGALPARALPAPQQPTPAHVASHNRTHSPYAPWC